jgi:hypothetical protein
MSSLKRSAKLTHLQLCDQEKEENLNILESEMQEATMLLPEREKRNRSYSMNVLASWRRKGNG